MEKKLSTFLNFADDFFGKVLSKVGYLKSENETRTYAEEIEVLRFHKADNNLRIRIALTKQPNGPWYIQFIMFSDVKGQYGDKKTFLLSTYIQEHAISKFPEVCEKGEDFESFTKNYFQNLTTACETYLHEQISGASFEEHDPAPGRV